MPLIKLSPADIKEIIRLDSEGVSHSEMARRFHVYRATIIRRLRIAGVKPKVKKRTVFNSYEPRPFHSKIMKNGEYKKVLAKSLSREPIIDEHNRLLGWRTVKPKTSPEKIIKNCDPMMGFKR